MQQCIPESVGLSSHRLQRLDAAMQSYVDEGILAGLVTLIARRGQIAHLKSYGYADTEAEMPMPTDAIHRIASMTKPICTVALLMLYERGLFQLTDPISRYLPGFAESRVYVKDGLAGPEYEPAERPITFYDLLTHTAGLSYGWNLDTPVDALYRAKEMALRNKPPLEWARDLAELPLVFQPGTAWRYSLATDLIGVLVAVIADRPLDQFLKERLFDPLGLVDTGFSLEGAQLARVPVLYAQTDDGLVRDTSPAQTRFAGELVFPSGGGGLGSPAEDYGRFAQMLLNGGEMDGLRLLSRKTVEMMTSNHLTPDLLPFGVSGNLEPGMGFGLGVRVRMDVAQSKVLGSVGDYGWSGAFCTDYWADPREQMIGLVMPQLVANGPLRIKDDFRVMAYQAIVD